MLSKLRRTTSKRGFDGDGEFEGVACSSDLHCILLEKMPSRRGALVRQGVADGLDTLDGETAPQARSIAVTRSPVSNASDEAFWRPQMQAWSAKDAPVKIVKTTLATPAAKTEAIAHKITWYMLSLFPARN